MNTTMLRIRQKEIVDIIKSKNLSIRKFEFTPDSNDFYSIKLKESDLYFRTDKDGFVMKPGLENKLAYSANAGGFTPTLQYLSKWLDTIVIELEIGNPWDESDEAEDFNFYEQVNSGHLNSDIDFSSEERVRVTEGLEKIELYILENRTLNQEQIDSVRQDIERLDKNASKISSKDWNLLLIGQMFSWLANGIITSEDVNSVYKTVVDYILTGAKSTLRLIGVSL